MKGKIIYGDCLEVLAGIPDNTFDITVTSPPYNTMGNWRPSGIFKKHGASWIKRANTGYKDDKKPEPYYQAWLKHVVKECLRVSKGLVWINHKIRWRDKRSIHPVRFLDFEIYQEIIWSRNASMDLKSKRYRTSHELILGFGYPHFWNNEINNMMSVWELRPRSSAREGLDHPCPFPPEIPRRLIKSSCPPGGTVFDPFIGSGTTALEAVKQGMDYFGIDNEQKYVNMTNEAVNKIGSVKRRKKPVIDIGDNATLIQCAKAWHEENGRYMKYDDQEMYEQWHTYAFANFKKNLDENKPIRRRRK